LLPPDLIPIQIQAEAPRWHGFTGDAPQDPALEALTGVLRLAAALGGGRAALVLRDGAGVWLRAGAGFSGPDWDGLAPLLAGPEPALEAHLAERGLRVLARADLGGDGGEGGLWALGAGARPWSKARGEALELLAGLGRTLLERARESAEQRARPRGPAGSSFVPGLVHELRNFSFGMSGSLDAFRARFGGQAEMARYERVMRASLDGLNAFLDELSDYGDPRGADPAERDPEPLLREAVDQHRERAAAAGVELRLELEGPLPSIRADAASLGTVFARLVGLALGRQERSGWVTVHAAAGLQDGGPALRGYVEGSRMAFPGLDLARLFEPFHFRASGFGRLGLPVARRVLERHGGSLRAVPGPAGGVRMEFTLPAVQPA
jgi:signal transduction histidine kinase